MFNPPRPEMNEEIRLQAATSFYEKNPDIQSDCCEEDVIQALVDAADESGGHDGYALARWLDYYAHWDIDAGIVSDLDDFETHLSNALHAAEKQWAQENDIKPPLPVGSRISFPHGGMQTGSITGVYQYMPACYKVKKDGETNENCFAIIKYEHATLLEEQDQPC